MEACQLLPTEPALHAKSFFQRPPYHFRSGRQSLFPKRLTLLLRPRIGRHARRKRLDSGSNRPTISKDCSTTRKQQHKMRFERSFFHIPPTLLIDCVSNQLEDRCIATRPRLFGNLVSQLSVGGLTTRQEASTRSIPCKMKKIWSPTPPSKADCLFDRPRTRRRALLDTLPRLCHSWVE
jgi:hypothetical protein